MVNKSNTKRGPKQAAKPRRQRVKQRRRGEAANAPAIVNTGVTVRSKAKRSMRMTGTDRLAGFTLQPGKPVGTILYERFVSVQMFPSLVERARTFQRVRYSSLTWRLVSESGTNVTGGVAAAFIKDADALVNDGEEGFETLMTHAGAKATKAWQELTVSANSAETFYVTPGSDLRFYSPGKFVIMTSGPVDKDSPFALYCDWTVELSRPGRNAPQKLVEQPTVTSSFIISGTASLECRNWDPSTGEITKPTHPEDLFGALTNVEHTDFTVPRYFRLPHPVVINWEDEQNGIDKYAITVRFVQLHLVNGLLIGRLCRLPGGKETDFFSDILAGAALFQGDILEPVSPYEFAGNTAGEFFVVARQSSFAPGRSYISKSVSRVSSTQSGSNPTGLEAIFKKFALQ